MKKLFTSLTLICFIFAANAFATEYAIEMVVPDGKKSAETDAVLIINKENMEIIPNKKSFQNQKKTWNYSDIKVADYSYSKKPMLSGGGAVATALLVGFIFALPFLFVKKKTHWLSMQTEDQFAVIKMDQSNFRAIIAEMETHRVDVKTVQDEEK